MILLFLFAFSFLHGANYPFPTHNTYYAGVIKPQVGQGAMDQAVEQLYQEWKDTYLAYRPNYPNQCYISYNQDGSSEPANAVSVSEGHGYGMIITAYMAGFDSEAQTIFDNLFRYYQAFPSVITTPLMGWQQVLKNGQIIANPKGGNDSATDGDMDIAFALLLADKQWGSQGSINYLSYANIMINAILSGDVNQEMNTLKLGDWVDNDDEDFGTATRPSDFMLNHIRNFRVASNNPKWDSVMTKTYSIINELFDHFSPQTGLLPDFSEFIDGAYIPATEEFLERVEDGYYSWNACRTPWRIAADYILSGDTRAFNQLTRLNNWILEETDEDPEEIKAGYKLDGTPLVEYSDLAFTTPFAVSAMIHSSNQKWLNDLWDYTSSQPTSESNYFNNTVRLLCLIMVSGNWWTPLNLPGK